MTLTRKLQQQNPSTIQGYIGVREGFTSTINPYVLLLEQVYPFSKIISAAKTMAIVVENPSHPLMGKIEMESLT